MKFSTQVGPRGTLELLSQKEVAAVSDSAQQRHLFDLFRRCALAVLNTGHESDDAEAIFAQFQDFSIEIRQRTRGLTLDIRNAPQSAFVEGRMIEGVRQNLFSVLRDIVYLGTEILDSERFDLNDSTGITDAVFHILKHAHVLRPGLLPKTVVCWGGHSISRPEYEFTKEVGYHLGLRGFDIATGCGPGAMKGPMKGAAVGHAKQRTRDARYIGLSEPGIIAAEPPNPMVSDLVILPDIEKRLEAFARMAHGIIIFPGGVGTVEEILYLLGVLTDPLNQQQALPVVFAGPESCRDYFVALDRFLRTILGKSAEGLYEIIVGDAHAVGQRMSRQIRKVTRQRVRDEDAFYFNWLLNVPHAHQLPFHVSHESVAALRLSKDRPVNELLVDLRRAFSAIVTGNVKDHGIRMIKRNGPFEIRSDANLVAALDDLLRGFSAQGRMKLNGEYKPCYVVKTA